MKYLLTLLFILSSLISVIHTYNTFNQYKLSNHYNVKTSSSRLLVQKSTPSDKLRVKLLQDSPQGKKNEILMVSKAMWLNVLLPKKLAVVVTDEELEALNKKNQEALANEINIASELAYELDSNDIIVIKRKIGSNGQLFGSVNHKAIIEEIKSLYKQYDNVINGKYFGVVSINELITKQTQSDSVEIIKSNELINEIRKSGLYSIRLKIHPKVNDIEIKLKIISL